MNCDIQERAAEFKLTPIHDRILVRVDPSEGISLDPMNEPMSKLIVIPDVREREKVCGRMVVLEDDSTHSGTVIETGPGQFVHGECSDCGKEWKALRPMSVKAGDRILFGSFADLSMDGLALIREDDILGILGE